MTGISLFDLIPFIAIGLLAGGALLLVSLAIAVKELWVSRRMRPDEQAQKANSEMLAAIHHAQEAEREALKAAAQLAQDAQSKKAVAEQKKVNRERYLAAKAKRDVTAERQQRIAAKTLKKDKEH